MLKQKALFIVNPKAGANRKLPLASLLEDKQTNTIAYELYLWNNPNADIEQVIDNAISNGCDVVVAVGGDGTVNRVASALVGKDIPLGILPAGSGNGLARHLKIPISLEKALRVINKGVIRNIDSCSLNNKHFFCTCGAGFDARIGALFANSKKRGFWSYFSIVFKELFVYKPLNYTLVSGGEACSFSAFLITFANANQFGNEIIIAPNADISDGLIDVTIIKPFSIVSIPMILHYLFYRNIHKSKYVETLKGDHFKLYLEDSNVAHFDGESIHNMKEMEVRVMKQSLSVYIP